MDDLYARQKRYYDLRAHEYDSDSWDAESEEAKQVVALVAALPPARTLDVACGTGFLSQHLRGELTLLDASDEMLAIASSRVPGATIVQADTLPLPFPGASFERLVAANFYGHLLPADRQRFLAEARHVAAELVVVDQTESEHREGPEERVLHDGSRHEIYKTYFSPASLLAELGGAELLHHGRALIVARL